MSICILACLAVVLHGNSNFASSVEFSGNITTNATWNADTVRITGNVLIEDAVTLTIEPGTYIELQGQYSIVIAGRILAEGNLNDTIVFTAASISSGWYGLKFDSISSTNDSSVLRYCKFLYGKKGTVAPEREGGALYISKFSKLVVDKCRFSNCVAYNGGAIYCTVSDLKISNSIFENNMANIACAIYGGEGSKIIITGNHFIDNEGYSVIEINNSKSIVNLNNIVNNNSYGIYCQDSDSNLISGNFISLQNFSGVSLWNSSVEMTDNVVSGNQEYGLEIVESSVILNNIIAKYNNWDGANFYEASGYVDKCEFDSNDGRGLGLIASSPVITNSNLSYNTCKGIACNKGSSPVLNNCNISHNNIGLDEEYGGGIYCNNQSSPHIYNSKICNNKAVFGAGISCTNQSSPNIGNSEICNNEASYGGGVYINYSSSPGLKNVLICNNNANVSGGALSCGNKSSPVIINNTICNNEASIGGGLFGWDTCNPVFINTILWDNTADPGNGSQVYIFDQGFVPDFHYCNLMGGKENIDCVMGVNYSGNYENNIDSDPEFENSVSPTTRRKV